MPWSFLILAADASDQTTVAVGIAVTGMLIVFLALGLISAFLALLPRVLLRVNQVWPEAADRHRAALAADAAELEDQGEVLAAIGYVLHVQAQSER